MILESEHLAMIERIIGRPLQASDLERVGSRSALSRTALSIARSIAVESMPLAVMYLQQIARGMRVSEAMSLLEDMRLRPPEAIERVVLALEGLSVGDAFGETFLRGPSAIRRLLQHELPPPPWPWTDDTQMAVALAEVLCAHGGVNQENLAQRFAARYEPHRGYGAGAHQLLRELRGGRRWDEAARALFGGQGSLGNGGAMRVAPVGAFFANDLDRVVKHAALSAEVTHAHPEGIAGAVAAAVAAALAWQWRARPLDPAAFLHAVTEHTPSSATRDGIAEALKLPSSLGPEEVARVLGNGSRITASDTVPFCLWVAAHHADSYPDALWFTASALGDIDTTCAIVGGIVALRCGVEHIPPDWRLARELLPELDWFTGHS